MSFSVLPRAKFYSSKQNTNTQEQTTTTTNQQTVKVNIDNANSVSINDKVDDVVKQNDENINEVHELKQVDDPGKIIEFLKLLLEAHLSNPIKYNGLVICSAERLQELIKTLVGCDEVKIDIDDIDVSCCGKALNNHFVPIAKIWCRTNEISEVFKYKYSNYLEVFDIYKISLKFIYVE